MVGVLGGFADWVYPLFFRSYDAVWLNDYTFSLPFYSVAVHLLWAFVILALWLAISAVIRVLGSVIALRTNLWIFGAVWFIASSFVTRPDQHIMWRLLLLVQ